MAKKKLINKNDLCCAECGSFDVHVQAWVNINTNEFQGDIGEDPYCTDCSSTVQVLTYKEFLQQEKENE